MASIHSTSPVPNTPAVSAVAEAALTPTDQYAPGLATLDLIASVKGLLGRERRTERLICRYLADLADRVRERRDRELDAYANELHAVRVCFGLGTRQARERIRIGRALRGLSRIERAFVEGRISYSRVREVTRVATSETDAEWLHAAQALDMRGLERRVSGAEEARRLFATAASLDAAASGEAPADPATLAANMRRLAEEALASSPRRDLEPERAEWTTPKSVRVTLDLTPEAWALVQRAMDGARRQGGAGFSDSEALEAVARDALAQQSQSPDASELERTVVVHRCESCGRSEVDRVEVDPVVGETLACGESASGTCQVPGCGLRRYVSAHRVGNGSVVLCDRHHRQAHAGRLRVDVPEAGEPVFWGVDGARILDPATQPGSPDMTTLLAIMGTRGGWDAEDLVVKSGLPTQRVLSALGMLEMNGRIVRRNFAYHPI